MPTVVDWGRFVEEKVAREKRVRQAKREVDEIRRRRRRRLRGLKEARKFYAHTRRAAA